MFASTWCSRPLRPIQEVTVDGADIVFKDIVEPLETVSVTMLKTDKTDVSEYGTVDQVRRADVARQGCCDVPRTRSSRPLGAGLEVRYMHGRNRVILC